MQDYEKGNGPATLAKAMTGIRGLDEIAKGGFPLGRTTLVCGGPGSGKTHLSMEFILKGAARFGEPGVFVSFEESAEELRQNFASFDLGIEKLVEDKRVIIDHVVIDPGHIVESGEYDLEGLFVRLSEDVEAIGAKRIALDTIESLFSGFGNEAILRAEVRRLFQWLKKKGITAVVTGERGEGRLTRQGLEEYIADCVLMLDHRVSDQIATRRLRIVKYRGSGHGGDEFPFLIDREGISVFPITSVGYEYSVSEERVSSGVPRLDIMLGGTGYYRGSTVLISGTAGTGKTCLASSFVDAACRRGERALYVAMEESTEQITRNMKSVGLDLAPHLGKGLLHFHCSRPPLCGLEMHLAQIYKLVQDFEPSVMVLDPLSNLIDVGTSREAKAMLARLIHFLRTKSITALFTSLSLSSQMQEQTEVGVSSIMDTWICLELVRIGGERNRTVHIVKSRGMNHSNQVREFVMTDTGVELVDVYLGPRGVITGSARAALEAQERIQVERRGREADRLRALLDGKKRLVEARMAILQAEYEAEEEEFRRSLLDAEEERESADDLRDVMARIRKSE